MTSYHRVTGLRDGRSRRWTVSEADGLSAGAGKTNLAEYVSHIISTQTQVGGSVLDTADSLRHHHVLTPVDMVGASEHLTI